MKRLGSRAQTDVYDKGDWLRAQAELSKRFDRLMWWIRAYLWVLVIYALVVAGSIVVRVLGG